MNSVIYTRDDREYESYKALICRLGENEQVSRAELNGHKTYKVVYDLVIVALDGAEGMEVVREYSLRFNDTRIIWISNDPFFSGFALRNHIYDFITRPVDSSWLEHSVREAARLTEEGTGLRDRKVSG